MLKGQSSLYVLYANCSQQKKKKIDLLLVTLHQIPKALIIANMSIILCFSLLILFTSTFIHGHESFDANTTDNILSSSSELNTLRQDNPIRIGKFY